MLSILDALADWNANKLAFAQAGGTPHSDEDERDQLHKILPARISSHAHDQPTVDNLVEWTKEKAIFIAEYGSKDGGAHLADADAEAPPPPPEAPAWTRRRRYWKEDEEEEEAAEEQVAQMTDSELLAFVRKAGSFKGGKGRKDKWGRKGGVWKGNQKGGNAPLPRDRNDLR